MIYAVRVLATGNPAVNRNALMTGSMGGAMWPEGSRLKVLFLCTGNSCRSQMAEGWAHFLRADAVEAYSAGIQARGVDARAVKVMGEVGIDISGQRSKQVEDVLGVQFDYVVTLCGHAHETCPMFSGKARVVHVGFDDPPALAKAADSEEEALGHYRRVRDEIKAFVEKLPDELLLLGGT